MIDLKLYNPLGCNMNYQSNIYRRLISIRKCVFNEGSLKKFSIVDYTLILRSMLFSFPVHVAAFSSIGIPFKEIIQLEGYFLLGSSISQIFGGALNDFISPIFTYGFGKLIAGMACLLIALFYDSFNIYFLFVLWGIGVGIYDGSDFVTALRNTSSFESSLRRFESLGIYGSVVSFIIGVEIFRVLGFRALFLSNAIVSFLIPILLLNLKDYDLVKCQPNSMRLTLDLKAWLFSCSYRSVFAIFSYAMATVTLKISIINLQNYFTIVGVDVFWNGWIFVIFSFFVLFLFRINSTLLRYGIIASISLYFFANLLGLSSLSYGFVLIIFTLLVRTSHKVLFLSNLFEQSPKITIGRDISLANIISGLVIMLGAEVSKLSINETLIVFCLFSILFLQISIKRSVNNEN